MVVIRRSVLTPVLVALVLSGVLIALPDGVPAFAASTARAAPAVVASSTKKTPAPLSGKALARLHAKIEAYVRTRPGLTTVSFLDETTGTTFTYARSRRIDTASIVKVDILATLLLQHQRAHTRLTSAESKLAVRMIEHSDNAAATALWSRIGGDAGLRKANKAFGLTQTTPGADEDWGLTTTSSADQVRLLRVLSEKTSVLRVGRRTLILRLMSHVESEQRWGVSAAADKGTSSAVKNGWLPRSTDDYRWIINSIGRVHVGTHVVLIGVLSRRNTSMGSGITTVEHVSRLVRSAILAA